MYAPSEDSIRRLLPTIDYSEALTVDAATSVVAARGWLVPQLQSQGYSPVTV